MEAKPLSFGVLLGLLHQVIAILDSRDRLQPALQEAQEKVRNAQAQLVLCQSLVDG